jgi:DNA-binding NarL/FixJ family response regulator
LRVVIVDDEPDVMLLLRIQLETRADIDIVATATDGEEGVEACRSHHPDAVVMDLLMPRMNGFEAIEVLQRDMPDVGVVAYSALVAEHVQDQVGRLGVPLLPKSGEPGPLVDALREVAARAGGK